jgi:hypothetical protein
LASIRHVYRRGHIFWWRRVLYVLGESGCGLSLPGDDATDEESLQAGAWNYEFGDMLTFLDVHEEVYRYLAETNCSGEGPQPRHGQSGRRMSMSGWRGRLASS